MRLGFDGKLMRVVWSLAWPTVAFSVLQSLLEMADFLMVRHLGKEAQAAVGFSQQFMMLVMIGALAVTAGTTTLVAQLIGAGRREEAGEAGRQGIVSIVLIGAVLAVPVVLAARPALTWMGAHDAVLAHAVPYLQLVFGGVPLVALNFVTSATFRGAGDVRTPLKIAAVANVANLGLNYAFIFGVGPLPAMGVPGAALGTVIARGISGMMGVAILSRPGGRVQVRWHHGLAFRGGLLRRMMRVGLPAAGAGLFRNGARFFYFKIVAATASYAAAIPALTGAMRMHMVVVMPALAFQVAATTLVGQAIGRGDRDEAERLGWEAIKFCAVIILIASAVQFVAAGRVAALFHREADVRAVSRQVLRFVAFGEVFMAISIAAGGALAGAGDTRPTLVYTFISQWVILLPLAAVLALTLHLDALGAWWAWSASAVPNAGLTVARFASGKWRHIVV
jgi:putative MATE family efflux protein